MKLKPVTWLILITLVVIVPLVFIFIVTRIIMDPKASWWWFFGLLMIYVLLGIIIGFIILILKLKSKPVPRIRLDPKTATEKAINEKKYDNDNPDNFKVESRVVMRVGEPGKPRTPILHLSGVGTEKNERINAIINLDNPKGEISWLPANATENQIKEAIRLMAENPETEITETSTAGTDMWGRPIVKTVTKKVSEAEREEQKEKKEAEESNII